MLYDVVCVRKKHYLVDVAADKVVERVNDICNNGYQGKNGWKPQGGISMVVIEGYAYAAQAIVCYEDEEIDRTKEIDVRLL